MPTVLVVVFNEGFMAELGSSCQIFIQLVDEILKSTSPLSEMVDSAKQGV